MRNVFCLHHYTDEGTAPVASAPAPVCSMGSVNEWLGFSNYLGAKRAKCGQFVPSHGKMNLVPRNTFFAPAFSFVVGSLALMKNFSDRLWKRAVDEVIYLWRWPVLLLPSQHSWKHMLLVVWRFSPRSCDSVLAVLANPAPASSSVSTNAMHSRENLNRRVNGLFGTGFNVVARWAKRLTLRQLNLKNVLSNPPMNREGLCDGINVIRFQIIPISAVSARAIFLPPFISTSVDEFLTECAAGLFGFVWHTKKIS